MSSTKSNLTGTSTSRKNQECLLYGVVPNTHRNQLIQRLAGLCDPDRKSFSEHEMVFTLKMDNPVQVRMRRRYKSDKKYWHCRYIGTPEVTTNCPTIVRKTVDSMMYSTDMMEYVKALGLRLDFEIIMDEGVLFTKEDIRIMISHISYTNVIGQYDSGNLRPLSQNNHFYVEASIVLPENQDYEPAAKRLRDFCDHLSPLCEMKKYEYWKS
ncbi:Mediator of RNA polymerase II transcription subunit 18 [Aphelenchoides besseyi]|nr:Mediator of RNA polymerase II transcription subunit 18 [Aphelenchoides besseyi]